ncbi:hypothetical protein CHU92_07165 [Flavobacterium cyanobacteriorum]|uniref:Letm1 RBD domain-containing protein n=1 Tax=Flavobacterium cyanobacteriorum TaxID=2022802 RepID=A0A255Z905_9FLAO|nr:LETM1-related biofilm-associated protein [Flavobacterium cyanobacteriorum]OYQ37938.1 hypothetical protein CHU92_07165 [Flavobacterium cyanobacteriorum]
MINPSASGWIDKFLDRYASIAPENTTMRLFYRNVRNSGFIYGHVTAPDYVSVSERKGWIPEEMTKVALLHTLYSLYVLETKDTDTGNFIKHAILFYKQMAPEGFSLLKKVLPAAPPGHELEDLLDERVKTNDNIISRNFSHILTNALLFMDVLAFRQYLTKSELPERYLKNLEETVVRVVLLALRSKKKQSEYDSLLIKLFESSLRYTKISAVSADSLSKIELKNFACDLEKFYLMDIAGMAIWTDGMADAAEIGFLFMLAAELRIDDETAAESIASFDVFIKQHKKDIPYFKYSNPVKHFYDHAAQTVTVLINRNKNRLIRELSNNGELMVLLTHSTHRSLDDKEKKKVKKQLLEICKTVPSLTIFLLPGGSLLLPLLIKFIPQLLPSVFNENLEKE